MTTPNDLSYSLSRDEVALDTVPEPLRGLITIADEQASEHFRRNGHAVPQWRALTASREYIFLADPPSPDKDVSAVLVRALLEIKEATHVVFCDEIWKVVIGQPDKELTAEQIAEGREVYRRGTRMHPKHTEAIMLIAESRDGCSYYCERTITRPQHGKAQLGPLKVFAPTAGEGRVVSWLKPATSGVSS